MWLIRANIKGAFYYLKLRKDYARPYVSPIFEGLKQNATPFVYEDLAEDMKGKVKSHWPLEVVIK